MPFKSSVAVCQLVQADDGMFSVFLLVRQESSPSASSSASFERQNAYTRKAMNFGCVEA